MKKNWLSRVVIGSILVGGFAVPMAANAARSWDLAAVGSDNVKTFVDTSSWVYVDGEPSQILFWFKRTGLNQRLNSRIVRSTVGREVVDCSDDTTLFGQIVNYDSKGRVVFASTTWDQQWQDIIPDSVGEMVRDFVCDEWDQQNVGG